MFDAKAQPQQAWSARDHFCGVSGSAWESREGACAGCQEDLSEVPSEKCASCDTQYCDVCSGDWLKQCRLCGEYFCVECMDRWNVEPTYCQECARKEDEEALR